jgi:hypothetical protein
MASPAAVTVNDPAEGDAALPGRAGLPTSRFRHGAGSPAPICRFVNAAVAGWAGSRLVTARPTYTVAGMLIVVVAMVVQERPSVER